jgi:hypothetical protein
MPFIGHCPFNTRDEAAGTIRWLGAMLGREALINMGGKGKWEEKQEVHSDWSCEK